MVVWNANSVLTEPAVLGTLTLFLPVGGSLLLLACEQWPEQNIGEKPKGGSKALFNQGLS